MTYLTDSPVVRPSGWARAAATLFAAAAMFQIVLVAGAPVGRFAWGGQHPGTLPPGLRVASIGSAMLLAGAAVLLARPRLHRRGRVRLLIGLIGLGVVSAALNGASSSAGERAVGVPFALALVTLLVLALRAEQAGHRLPGHGERTGSSQDQGRQ
jgi:hypothetical protein